ncbi:MAG: TonB-dependent receptor [Stagnimonas sp.]|nr:TonB-dependent receptor [Stagnimonas sp.]
MRARRGVTSGLLLCAAAGSAWAQAEPVETIPVQTLPEESAAPATETDASAVQLDAVVVKGEKLGRTLKDTASSVSVTTGKQIEQYGDESIYDLTRRVGNALSINEGGLSLRGVSQFGADNSNSGAPVISTYVDGVALDSTALGGSLTDAFDVEQVEILRGPQSTSQGRNALAGAVVTTTRNPTDDWDALARVRLANDGNRQYALAGGGPLGAGFAFRLTGQRAGQYGGITNTTRDDPKWARTEDELLRGKLGFKPAALPGLSTVLSFSTVKSEPATDYNLEADDDGAAARRTARDNEDTIAANRSKLASLKADYALGDTFTLSSTTGGVRTFADFFGDYDRTAEDGGTYETHTRGNTLSQELRLGVKDASLWRGVTATGLFGVYASRFQDASAFDFRDLLVPLSAVVPLPGSENIIARVDGFSDTDRKGRNIAFFTEFDFKLTATTTLTTGLRYDRERSTIIANSDITRADGYLFGNETAPGIPLVDVLKGVGVLPTTDGEQRATGNYSALLPKVGLRQVLSPAWTVFITYSEAYRAGGAEVLRGSGTINQYKPEYTRNLETGFRATPSQRVAVNFNLYGVQWRDQQVRVPVDGDILSTRTENAARSELFGAELETTWKPLRGLNLYTSLGYAHTEFKDYVSGGIDYSGKHFVFNAPFTGSIGGSYSHRSGLFGALNFSASDGYFVTPANNERERGESRRLVDARLGWQGRYVALYGYGRNLLGEDYRTLSYRIEPGLGLPTAGYGVSYGELRQLGVQLEARF